MINIQQSNDTLDIWESPQGLECLASVYVPDGSTGLMRHVEIKLRHARHFSPQSFVDVLHQFAARITSLADALETHLWRR